MIAVPVFFFLAPPACVLSGNTDGLQVAKLWQTKILMSTGKKKLALNVLSGQIHRSNPGENTFFFVCLINANHGCTLRGPASAKRTPAGHGEADDEEYK